jgi:thiamine-phosphate pyrophosphorylase
MEIKKKIDQGCEAIFLSPIFRIEKSRKYLGVCRFKLLTLKYRRKFIALGGIRKKNTNILKMLNIYGMAGISLLKKNRPNNLGRFL